MKLSQKETQEIIKNFPYIEPSYENIINKHINNYDIVLALPEGNKCYIWFSTYKNQSVCFLLEFNKKNMPDISFILLGFNTKLSMGTIFYGTIVECKNNKYIALEDVFYYKGKNISNYKFNQKLEIFYNFFENDILNQNIHLVNNTNVILKMCILSSSKNGIDTILTNKDNIIPYKIKYLNYRFFNIVKKSLHSKYNKEQDCIVLNIRPTNNNDIYKIYITPETIYDTLYIPSYKSSLMMHKLLRNNKNIGNLDAIEESDNEDDNLCDSNGCEVIGEISVNMKCKYNHIFKKFYPICVTDERISSLKEIQNFIN